MRRMAYFSLTMVTALTVKGMVAGSYPPEHVYYAFTAIIAAWAGFSKWGEIKGA